jgi:phosphoribosylanthranilate isomerase
MLVKVCGITNAEDAMAAVEQGAHALGFNFYAKSPRYLSPREAGAITAALPAGVLKIGVFVNADEEQMKAILDEAHLDIVQLHGDERTAPAGMRVWKAAAVHEGFQMEQLDRFPAEAYVLDTPTQAYGGSGHTFPWNKVHSEGRRIIIAGGLDASNVGEAIAATQPWGVDACSRLESSPGKKDHGRMARFIAAALSAC